MRNKTPKLRVRSDACSLFFVGSDGSSNAQQAAERLLRIKGVREVKVTGGTYAFVIKSTDVESTESVRQYLARRHGQAAALECYYTYSK